MELAREYVEAVERAAAARAGVLDFEHATAAWTRWARATIDAMDPLKPRTAATSMSAWGVEWSSQSISPETTDGAGSGRTAPASPSTITSA